MLHKESGLREQQLRAPFAILAQNVHNVDNSQVTTPKECLINGKVFWQRYLEYHFVKISAVYIFEFVDNDLDFNQVAVIFW